MPPVPSRLSKLSVDEIRERYARADEPVSPQALSKLKRDPRHGVRAALRDAQEALRARQRRAHAARRDAELRARIVARGRAAHRGRRRGRHGPVGRPRDRRGRRVPAAHGAARYRRFEETRLEQREDAERRIRAAASGIGIGRAEVEEIDTVNIYHAGLLAMRRAVEALPMRPQHVLVDARNIPGVDVPQNCFNKGDGLDFSIAAASIVAKMHRDRLMDELAREHPGYGFERHKGYCTPEHQDAIRRLGPCAIHRTSFTFIRELRGEYSALFYDLKRRLDAAAAAAELEAIDQELAASRDALSDSEQRKLRLVLSRRWRAL